MYTNKVEENKENLSRIAAMPAPQCYPRRYTVRALIFYRVIKSSF